MGVVRLANQVLANVRKATARYRLSWIATLRCRWPCSSSTRLGNAGDQHWIYLAVFPMNRGWSGYRWIVMVIVSGQQDASIVTLVFCASPPPVASRRTILAPSNCRAEKPCFSSSALTFLSSLAFTAPANAFASAGDALIEPWAAFADCSTAARSAFVAAIAIDSPPIGSPNKFGTTANEGVADKSVAAAAKISPLAFIREFPS